MRPLKPAVETESDRGAAVLACSLIENYLAKYMKSKMIVDKIVEDLFHGFGPFATFSQRYKAAYVFGIIPKMQMQVLAKIQDIRNYFSHKPFVATFEDQKVSDSCKTIPIANLLALDYEVLEDCPNLSNRSRYLVAISILISDWETKMSNEAK
jgi:DNA-binding MltR family transcriptional regulator